MIDKNYWLNFCFLGGYPIDVKCPTCWKGKLNILEKFAIRESRDAIDIQKGKYGNYDIEFIDEKFSGLLTCDFCNDVVAVCGTSNFESNFDPEDLSVEYEYYRRFKVEYFSPPLNIFPLKHDYPKRVKDILKKSFSLFFIDPDSCGNKIRISVEALLDDLNADRKNSESGKMLSLHQRIKKYQIKNEGISQLMLSIKWIGNYGSHNDSISRSDLLDAYEMIQSILDYLYDNQEKKLMELAKKINDNKRPASKIFTKFDNLNSKS